MATMNIILNGENKAVASNASLDVMLNELLDPLQTQAAFAVALNEQFIPKSAYESTKLCEGDRIELLVPMQGG